jgi:hypothetical protein
MCTNVLSIEIIILQSASELKDNLSVYVPK